MAAPASSEVHHAAAMSSAVPPPNWFFRTHVGSAIEQDSNGLDVSEIPKRTSAASFRRNLQRSRPRPSPGANAPRGVSRAQTRRPRGVSPFRDRTFGLGWDCRNRTIAALSPRSTAAMRRLAGSMGAPQCVQASADSRFSLPHSVHSIIAKLHRVLRDGETLGWMRPRVQQNIIETVQKLNPFVRRSRPNRGACRRRQSHMREKLLSSTCDDHAPKTPFPTHN